MVRALLFDLDNTLYSEFSGMEDNIVRYMNDFVASVLGVSPEEAYQQRRAGVRHYGTSLEWLVKEKGFTDIEAYLAAIHPEGEEDCLEFDPELAPLLDAIPLPKAILTNSPREHAERVLVKLGVADQFQQIYDIRRNNFVGKPAPSSFIHTADDFGYAIDEIVFIDDLPKYLQGWIDLGGRGILKDEANRFVDRGFERICRLDELPSRLGY